MGALVKKTKGTTALTTWESELAKHAEEASAVEQTPSGNFISFKGGMLTVAGQPVKGNEADVIVLDFVYENKKYNGKYDADNPQPPSCYAFARTEEELKPHEKCGDPQNEQCAGCKHNEWGSAEQGRGKACKNTRRLALISTNGIDSPQGVKDADVFFAEIPVTSVKGWSGYVKAVAATLKRPPFGVVTKLSTQPDTKTQFKVIFSDPRPVPPEWGPAIMEKVAEVKTQIDFPYPEAREQEEAPKGGKKRKF